MKLLHWVGFLSIGFSSLAVAGEEEFLVQKVCVTAAGVVTSQDPYTCKSPNRLRALAIGEPLPYRKSDYLTANNVNGYQQSDSFPLPDGQGGVQYVSTMRMAPGATLEAQAAQRYFNPDGFNLISTGAGWVNFFGTKDASGPQQFYGPGCNRMDSWRLFPLGLAPGQSGSTVATLRQFRPDYPCMPDSWYVPAYTAYEYLPMPFTYTSGKSITTIVTTHYGAGSIEETANYPGAGYEVDYFTPLYGLTRWEGWQRVADHCQNLTPGSLKDLMCQNKAPVARTGCNGPTLSPDRRWVRMGCRDWTNIKSTTVAGNVNKFYPYATKIDPGMFFSANRLQNTDLLESPLTWERYYGADGQVTNWQIVLDPKTNRKSLAFSCVASCNGNTVFQRVPISPSSGTKLDFGVQAWTDRTTSVTVARVALFQLNAAGAVTVSNSLVMRLNADKEMQYGTEVPLRSDTTQVIWAIYPSEGNLNYFMTNPWVAVK